MQQNYRPQQEDRSRRVDYRCQGNRTKMIKHLLGIITISVIVLTYISTAFAETNVIPKNDSYILSNSVKFGMTVDEVKSVTSGDLLGEKYGQVFYTNISHLGEDGLGIMYQFNGNPLTLDRVLVFFSPYVTNDKTIGEFNKIDDLLISQYGYGEFNKKYIWSDESLKGNEIWYGIAISMGYLEICSVWHLDDMLVYHMLYGKDSINTQHALIYMNMKNENY